MGVGLDAIEAVPRWRCAEENGHLGALHARRKGETGPFRRRWEHRGPIPAETLQREVVRPIRELESESQNGNSGSTFICGSPAAKSNLSVRSSVFQVLVPRYLNRKIQERKSHPVASLRWSRGSISSRLAARTPLCIPRSRYSFPEQDDILEDIS